MKSLLLTLGIILASQTSWARTVDLFPLHFQYRYEDTSAQAIETVLYQGYSLGVSVNKVRGTLALSTFKDSTGNNSLQIETKVEELLLGLGYEVFTYSNGKINIYVNALGLIGTTKTQAKTQLLGASSTSTSDKQMVYGVGAEALARISYFVAGVEMSVLNSKNFSPQVVPAVHFKIGAGIPF